MDLSETIVAAMIGAGATVATASFQLFMAFRSRKADSKPKRSSGIRSTLAVFGLVLGAAVAGFAYSELRVERERESARAMEQRISDRLQALADVQLAQLRNGHPADEAALPATTEGSPSPERSEAMIHIAACRSQAPAHGNDPVGCDIANANRVAVCVSVPSQAAVHEVQLFARADGLSPEWEPGRVSVDQDIGGARFVDSTYEIEQGADRKAVCANFSQWNSEHGHAARVVAVYTMGPAVPTAPVPMDSGDSSLAARPGDDAADSGDGGTVGADSVTRDIVSSDPALGAAQAAIASQP